MCYDICKLFMNVVSDLGNILNIIFYVFWIKCNSIDICYNNLLVCYGKELLYF